MIERDLRKFLEKVANTELKVNRLAQFLAIYWDSNDEIPTDSAKIFEKLVPSLKDHLLLKDQQDQIKPSNSIDNDQNDKNSMNDDFRIFSIRLSSVRGIRNKVNEIPFGIDLMEDSCFPCNAIIVGNNGSGKTSIFSALEYAYTGEISEAKLRRYGTEKEPNFYDYLKNTYISNDPFCEIQTINKTYDLKVNTVIDQEHLNERANPQASFISEYAVYNYGASDFSGEDDYFHNKIAEILGFKEYIIFAEYLSILQNKPRKAEINRWKSNQKAQNEAQEKKRECEENLRQLRDQLIGKTPGKALDKSRQDIENIKGRQSEKVEEIPTVALKEQYRDFVKAFSEYNSMRSKVLKKEEIQFLELGLKLLEKVQDCPFCRQSKFDIKTIKNNVIEKLEDVKKISELDQSLSKTYIDILDNLDSLVLGLMNFQRLIENDLQMLSTIPRMDGLTKKEKELKDNPNFADLRDLLMEIEKLQRRSSFDNQARENLYQFLTDKTGFFFDNTLINEVEAFINKREQILAEVISKLQKTGSDSTIDDGEDEIEFKIKTNEENMRTYESAIQTLKQRENDLKKDKEALELIKSDVIPLLNRVEKEINVILTEAIKPMEDVLKNTLEMFLEEGLYIEIKFKETSKDKDISRKRLVIELVDKKTGTHTTPKKYFNTFRYKIFCGTISIGVAIASRKNLGINLPLILDDEFFASDIVNRSEFESYFRGIILMYRKITPNLPFQFILFTHDELIFESAKEAVVNVWKEIQALNKKEERKELSDYWKSSLANKTKFARLLPSLEKDDDPREMEGEKYWNLLFEFNLQEI